MKLESETEVRSKNSPAITDYRHRCGERHENKNLQDYNFDNVSNLCLIFIYLLLKQTFGFLILLN